MDQVKVDEIIEREIAALGPCGPFHRHWLLQRSPEKLRRVLEQHKRNAERFPHLTMARQGFASADVNDGNTADFTARNTSLAELNILGADAAGVCPQAIVNQYCAIPGNDARAGKIYKVVFSGLYGNTATPTLIWTPRWGNSTVVATNISLGASATFTTIVGSTALPFYGEFLFTVRTAPPGATLGTGKGHGWVAMQIPVTSSQLAAMLLMGKTAATIDTTGQGAAGCGLTINATWSASAAANTITCENFLLTSLN